MSVAKLSCNAPVLLVFLRHGGCTFCREALADIAARRHDIEAGGTRIVLAHMGGRRRASISSVNTGLTISIRLAILAGGLYRAFGLRRGNLWKLFGPKVWLRGFDACILKGHGVGRLAGDPARCRACSLSSTANCYAVIDIRAQPIARLRPVYHGGRLLADGIVRMA